VIFLTTNDLAEKKDAHPDLFDDIVDSMGFFVCSCSCWTSVSGAGPEVEPELGEVTSIAGA
jgi:hypothetical protein